MQPTAGNKRTYQDAGYNSFFRRTLSSNPNESSLANAGFASPRRSSELNFDDAQTSGSLGTIIQLGPNVEINGPETRMAMYENGVEVLRLGKRDS